LDPKPQNPNPEFPNPIPSITGEMGGMEFGSEFGSNGLGSKIRNARYMPKP
jgi:hypothetical protein